MLGVRPVGILGGMRVKTSITLAPETVAAIDRAAGPSNRSRFIEAAVLEALARREREERDASDREILERDADALNLEMEDALSFQAEP